MFYLSNLCSIKFIEKGLFIKMCFVIENFRKLYRITTLFQQNNGLLSFEYEILNCSIIWSFSLCPYYVIREFCMDVCSLQRSFIALNIWCCFYYIIFGKMQIRRNQARNIIVLFLHHPNKLLKVNNASD